MGPLNLVLCGALVGVTFVVGVFFLRYWVLTRDRLFVFFAAAFWLFGANWAGIAAIGPTEEARPYLYLLRLAGFLLIATAILDKNRKRP